MTLPKEASTAKKSTSFNEIGIVSGICGSRERSAATPICKLPFSRVSPGVLNLHSTLFHLSFIYREDGMKPLMIEEVSLDRSNGSRAHGGDPTKNTTALDRFFAENFKSNPEFFKQAFKLFLCCVSLR